MNCVEGTEKWVISSPQKDRQVESCQKNDDSLDDSLDELFSIFFGGTTKSPETWLFFWGELMRIHVFFSGTLFWEFRGLSSYNWTSRSTPFLSGFDFEEVGDKLRAFELFDKI